MATVATMARGATVVRVPRRVARRSTRASARGCERCDARAKEAGRETRGGRTDGDDWTRARTREGVESSDARGDARGRYRR